MCACNTSAYVMPFVVVQINASGLRALLAAGTCQLLGLTDQTQYEIFNFGPASVRLHLYVFGPANNPAYAQAMANMLQLAGGMNVQGPIPLANIPNEVRKHTLKVQLQAS